METSPPGETTTISIASLQTDATCKSTEHPTSGTPNNFDTTDTCDNGDIRNVADFTMKVAKATSTQSPKIPVTYSDDEVKTDTYSDDENIPDINNVTQIPVANAQVIDTGNDAIESSTHLKHIPDINNVTHIPVANAQVIDTGNDAIGSSTDPKHTSEMTKQLAEPKSKSAVLKLQPLKDIKVDIWSNTVREYYQFLPDPTPSNVNNTSVAPVIEENNEQPISLRGRKSVNYTSMLTSDIDSEVEIDKKKPGTKALHHRTVFEYRPRASGPSALRKLTNKHSKLSKTTHTKNPTHSYPIRGY